jgi:hypothetical protein
MHLGRPKGSPESKCPGVVTKRDGCAIKITRTRASWIGLIRLIHISVAQGIPVEIHQEPFYGQQRNVRYRTDIVCLAIYSDLRGQCMPAGTRHDRRTTRLN